MDLGQPGARDRAAQFAHHLRVGLQGFGEAEVSIRVGLELHHGTTLPSSTPRPGAITVGLSGSGQLDGLPEAVLLRGEAVAQVLGSASHPIAGPPVVF